MPNPTDNDNPGTVSPADQPNSGAGVTRTVDGDGTDGDLSGVPRAQPAAPDAAIENQAPAGGLPRNVNVG